MYIADRLREFREYKNLSQGDLQKRTGLLRCYISRVENGHTVPALEALEKIARGLEVSLYQLFYENEETPATKPSFSIRKKDWASQGKGLQFFAKLSRTLSRMSEKDRQVLLAVAAQLKNGNHTRKS
jgi:transcriptional regulator with XRE-family HTH domain